MKRKKTEAEILMDYHLQELNLVPFVSEHRFFEGRKWAFDRAVLWMNMAVEIEGGIWIVGGGGHNRGRDFQEDLDKHNAATSLGWALFCFSCEDIEYARDLDLLRRYIEYRRSKDMR